MWRNEFLCDHESSRISKKFWTINSWRDMNRPIWCISASGHRNEGVRHWLMDTIQKRSIQVHVSDGLEDRDRNKSGPTTSLW
jgi:hypothetical protein